MPRAGFEPAPSVRGRRPLRGPSRAHPRPARADDTTVGGQNGVKGGGGDHFLAPHPGPGRPRPRGSACTKKPALSQNTAESAREDAASAESVDRPRRPIDTRATCGQTNEEGRFAPSREGISLRHWVFVVEIRRAGSEK